MPGKSGPFENRRKRFLSHLSLLLRKSLTDQRKRSWHACFMNRLSNSPLFSTNHTAVEALGKMADGLLSSKWKSQHYRRNQPTIPTSRCPANDHRRSVCPRSRGDSRTLLTTTSIFSGGPRHQRAWFQQMAYSKIDF